MIYILIIFLLELLLLEYFTSRADILHISFSMLLVFIFACLVVIINTSWDYKMSFGMLMLVFSSFIVIFAGEHITRLFYHKPQMTYEIKRYAEINVNPTTFLMSIIFMTLVAIIYSYSVIRLGRTAMLQGMSSSLFGAYRQSAIQTGSSVGLLLSLLLQISECIAYTYLLLFISSRKGKYLIPILLYIFPTILSTARSEIVKIIISGIVFYYFVCTRPSGNSTKFVNKFLKVVILGAVAFVGLGFLTGKANYYHSFFENVSMYIGSSIPAFDEYLSNFHYDINNFGAETLWGINNFFSKFGIRLFNSDKNYLPYTYFSYMNHSTNIYTFLRRPLNDFGLVGTYLIMFILSVVYTRFYLKLVNSQYVHATFALFAFATLYYPVFWIFADFRFFDVISITGIFELIVYYLIAHLIDKKLEQIQE